MKNRLLLLVLLLCLPASVEAGFPKNLLADLKAERAKYGATLTQADAGALINAVTWKNRDLGFGLLRKDGGNNCPVAGLAVRVSCDWIVNRNSGTGCDVLGSGPDADNPGPSNPAWCDGEPFDASRFVAPVDPGTVGSPAPVPTSPDPRVAELEARVKDLARQFDAATAQLGAASQRVGELEAERDDLKTQLLEVRGKLDALLSAPPPSCEAKVPSYLKALGVRVGCTVVTR